MPILKGRATRRVWFWLRLIAAASLLWFVIERNGKGRIIGVLLSAQPVWVLTAALLFLISVAVGAYQWYLLLRIQGIESLAEFLGS